MIAYLLVGVTALVVSLFIVSLMAASARADAVATRLLEDRLRAERVTRAVEQAKFDAVVARFHADDEVKS